MRRHARPRDVIAILAALAIGGLALSVGAAWGIVVVEGAAALVAVILFLRSMNEGPNGDVDG